MSEIPHTPPPDSATNSAPENPSEAPVESSAEAPEVEAPPDPVAEAADREGFRFLAIGFALFFILIAVCASIVAAVMKNMGI